MSNRFSLRFESGERAGEVVPITGASFTVGRKPGNSLQLIETSVSGSHAEFLVTPEGVRLKDLGSTNGTRVAGEPITDAILAAGCSVHLGQVQMAFLDADVAQPSAMAEQTDGPRVVSEESLVRSRKKGSKLGLLALVLIGAAGAGAKWYLDQGGGAEQQPQRPVPKVAGNLLSSGFSFEESVGWESAEDLPVTFRASARSRYSGLQGLSADVIEGEAAEHHSALTSARPGAGLVARAQVRVRDGAALRIGLRFQPTPEEESSPGETVIWSQVVSESPDWSAVEVAATTPGGYDQVQVVVRAEATSADGGLVEVDDVSLVPGSGSPAIRIGNADFYLDGGNLTLFEVDSIMLSSFQLRDAKGETQLADLKDEGLGVRFSSPEAGTLTFRVEVPALEGGLATLGSSGYTARDGGFEAEGVTDMLFGSAHDLVRISLGAPVNVRAVRLAGGALEVEASLGTSPAPLIQLVFDEERRRMIALSALAEKAEGESDFGAALMRWKELLNEVPFDAPAVARAQAARARLLQAGFEETSALVAEIERARFFRLVDLYRQCRQMAEAIRARYAGSEVASNAAALVSEIDKDLQGLEADLDRYEVARLLAVLAGLRVQEATALAGEVEDYLAEKYGRVR